MRILKIEIMKKICKNYVGVSCVNEIYPQAQKEEYEERGIVAQLSRQKSKIFIMN